MKIIIRYIVLIALLGNSIFTEAQNVYNVFTNESLGKTRSLYSKVTAKNSVFKNKIEIMYFKIDDANTKALKSLNEQSFDLCKTYILDDTKALKLMSELSQRLKVKKELINSRNNNFDERETCSSQNIPLLAEIKSSIISMFANKLFIEVKFEFNIGNRRSYDNELYIRHYYIADLKTGKISRWKNNISNKNLNIISDKLSYRVNKIYSQANSEFKLSEIELLRSNSNYYDEDSQKENSYCKDICTRIDFAEADFYCYAWGVVAEFQKYTNSSKIFYGEDFLIFIPLDEAKSVFKNIKPLSFIQNVKESHTSIKNHVQSDYFKRISYFRKPPEIKDVILTNKLKVRPKSLVITGYQLFKNKTISNNSKKEYEYDYNYKVLRETVYTGKSENYYKSTYFSYDSTGLLISKIVKSRKNDETSNYYSYDQNNNLKTIFSRSTDGSDNDIKYYYYSGNNIYYFILDNAIHLRKSEGIRKITYEKHKIRTTNTNYYSVNNEGQIEGFISERHYNNGQIGRDSIGRVVESHFENDRYNYYWSYDSNNRLKDFLFYENANQKSKVEYLYKDSQELPYKRIFTRYSYSNKTVLVEEYKWEFFEE